MTTIFDDQGRAWRLESEQFRRELACGMPDFDLAAYVVDNLGFVALTRMGGRGARLRFRPTTVTPAALAAALYALADRRPGRIMLSHARGNCGDELVGTLDRALARIAALVGYVPDASRPPFAHVARSLSTIGTDPLGQLLRRWQDQEGRFDTAAYADLLDGTLRQRFMIVSGRSDRLTIDAVGTGFGALDPIWVRRARGLPMEQLPDHDYGLWVRAMFQDAMASGIPRLDDIDAIIRRPYFGDHIHARYRRLLLPCRDPVSRAPILLGASAVDDAIDLCRPAALAGVL